MAAEPGGGGVKHYHFSNVMVSSADFEAYGFSSKMGPRLREVVEQQLRKDLLHYGLAEVDLHFDWSNSCLEGSDAVWLDGHIENYSGIALLDKQAQAVAEGWMEFILVDGLLLVYWDNLTSWDATGKHVHKKHFGIPPHIWSMIPEQHRFRYAADRMRNPPFGPV